MRECDRLACLFDFWHTESLTLTFSGMASVFIIKYPPFWLEIKVSAIYHSTRFIATSCIHCLAISAILFALIVDLCPFTSTEYCL